MKTYFSLGILLLFCSSMLFLVGCNQQSTNTSLPDTEVERISLAGVKSLGQAPYIIAERLGYFAQAGLAPEIVWMGGGDQVFKALTAKSVDMALVGMVPYGFVAAKFPDIKLVNVITELNDTKLVVRKDRIGSLQELSGKRIGYTKGTASDIWLEQLQEQQGYTSGELIGVNLAPPALAVALAQGEIDGYMAREPNIAAAQKVLWANAQVYSGDGVTYTRYFSLFGDESSMQQHNEQVEQLVWALTKASDYIVAHPQETQEIMAEFLEMDRELLAQIWWDYRFTVGFTSTHRTALEEIFAWAARATNTPSLPTQSIDKSLYQWITVE